MTRIAASASLLAVLLAGAAQASVCDLPSPPGCARDAAAFDDQGDYEDCRRQMARYRAEVRVLLDCVQQERDATTFGFDRRLRR